MPRRAHAVPTTAVVVAIAVILACTSGCHASDLDTVKQRMVAALLPSDSAGAIRDAYTVAASMYPNGSFPGINYHDKGRAKWSPGAHVDNVETMAIGQRLGANSTVLKAINTALSFWVQADPESPNWWWNEIAVPQSLSRSCLLLGSNVSSALVPPLLHIMERANYTGWTASNYAWMVEVQIRRGLFVNNATLVQQGFDLMWGLLFVSTQQQDGIQVDSSFHQHGPELLAGSYGAVYTSLMLSVVSYTGDTSFAPSAAQLDIFCGLVVGQAWMTRAQNWDVSVVGRGVTRPSSHGQQPGFSGTELKALARQCPADKADLVSQYADRLGGDDSAPRLVGSRSFYDSDFAVHRDVGFYWSVKMFSNRTIAARCVNEEAKTAQHMSDGFVSVMYTGHEYDDMGALWEYHHLPGITAEQNTPYLPCSFDLPVNSTVFVGSVVATPAATSGLSGMNLTANSLHALRSWHAINGGLVAFSTPSCSSTNPVHTTLASRRLSGDVLAWTAGSSSPSTVPAGAATLSNLSLLHHDSTVYAAASPAASLTVDTFHGSATGNWGSVGVSTSNVTADVFRAHVDHGVQPSGTFAYVMLPAVDASDAADALTAFHKDVTILASSSSVHATHSAAQATTRAVFWDASGGGVDAPGVGSVTVSAQAFVEVKVVNATAVSVSAATPIAVDTLTVSLAGFANGSGDHCLGTTAGTKVSLPMPAGSSLGATVTAVCSA